MEELVICISTPMELDILVFNSWMQGVDVNKVKLPQTQGFEFRNRTSFSATDMARKDIYDQYRTFELLEHYLQNPPLLKEQMLVEFDHQLQVIL